MFALTGCAMEKAGAKALPQTQLYDTQQYENTDPFEKETPSLECFENEQAIKEAYGLLEKARDSFFAALFLPSFSFYILENKKTGERKMVFAEKHRPPQAFIEKEWRVVEEAVADPKTIAACAAMLELQKF